MNTLSGKTVMVTGASGGIGQACVCGFMEAGARVVAADIGAEPEVDSDAGNYLFVQTDVSDEQSVQALVSAATGRFGAIDVLVNNAAVLTPALPVHETSLADFEKLVAVNIGGPFLCSKYCYPWLREVRGCIVHVSSMAGITGEKDHAIYAATKGAINALTQSMAVDYGREGIRVNAVCPGGVDTPNARRVIEASPDAERLLSLRDSLHALGTTATPEQVAAVVVFLASPAAGFMTGALVPVSGGMECGYGIKH